MMHSFSSSVLVIAGIFITWRSSYAQIKDKSKYCHEIKKIDPNFCTDSITSALCRKTCGRKHATNRLLRCGRKPAQVHSVPASPHRPPHHSAKDAHQRVRRIVGGTVSKPGHWPWHVSLRMNGTQWCSGSILAKNIILTAAHCFDEDFTSRRASDWLVVAGDHSLKAKDQKEEEIDVKSIIFHPQYTWHHHEHKKGSFVVGQNDIDDKRPPHHMSECVVVGWGHTSWNGSQPDVLHEAKVLLVPRKICNLPIAYNNTVTKGSICAGFEEGGVDACNYDSGGALSCRQKGNWFEYGIVSSGFECARPHAYGLYTNVFMLKKWIIESVLKSNY